MLEQLPVCHDPLIVADELIPNRGGRDRRGGESCNQNRLASRYSHSIVAGGLELTS